MQVQGHLRPHSGGPDSKEGKPKQKQTKTGVGGGTAGEMAEDLGALVDLTEDPGMIPNPHGGLQSSINSSSRGSNALPPLASTGHIHTCMQALIHMK